MQTLQTLPWRPAEAMKENTFSELLSYSNSSVPAYINTLLEDVSPSSHVCNVQGFADT